MPDLESPKAKRPAFDYERAKQILKSSFARAEELFRSEQVPPLEEALIDQADLLFGSNTQSYREALIGCTLARIIDPDCDIRLPYVNQGSRAFNGRTLDEQVVNPFLQTHQVPCSKGPYLASIRRSVKFIPETAQGLRDKAMYGGFLEFISALENGGEPEAQTILDYILYRFVLLREAAQVTLARVLRLSLEQTAALLKGMLGTQSGGLVPVLIAVATFQTIKAFGGRDWEVDWQGINVADRATGVGGDITLTSGGKVITAVEVTEREIDRSRVVSTFNTKIAPNGLAHYMFLHSSTPPTADALAAGKQYFAQGHDIVFFPIDEWVMIWLGTVGPEWRSEFINKFLELLDNKEVPASVKISWNHHVQNVIE